VKSGVRILFISFAFFAATLNFTLHADPQPLRDVIDQLNKDRRIDAKAERRLYGAEWFKANTNFAKLFTSADGPQLLIEWIGVPRDLGPRQSTYSREREYVIALRKFDTPHSGVAEISVMVPHPKYRQARVLGLLPEFSALTPPKLKVTRQINLEINNHTAQYFDHELDRDAVKCTIVIPLVVDAVLVVSANRCQNTDALIEIGRSIDLERLEAKLNS
jgi:hypothetical protein